MLQSDIDAFQFAGQDIPWLLRHWAEATPDNPFFVWEPRSGEDRTWSYAQFHAEVEAVAAGLHARGVTKGDKVLVHADNCPEGVLAWYACARLGAVAVTTNTRSVANEINYFATHTGCVGAITQPQFAQLVDSAVPDLGWMVITEDDSGVPATAELPARDHSPWSSLLDSSHPAAPERAPEPMLPAGILFTSGTTSRPKAVVHTHANALWASRSGPTNIDMVTGDSYLIYLPFFHVNAQSWSIWTTLGVGGKVVMQPKFSASKFWAVIAKHSITHISLIPFVFKAVADQPVPEHTVKVGVFGLIMPELDGWLGMRVVAAYGMTETVIHAVHGNQFEHYPRMSMGKPTPGYEIAIVDPETGELCGEGQIGELWMRGTRGIQLFLEYFDNDEANAKAFTEDGWLRTGDLMHLGPDGNLVYDERDKDALKVGGENVSTREVEDTCRLVAGIDEIAVVGKHHEMLDVVAVAFIVKAAGAPDDETMSKAIIEACKENLADFKVPRAVYFIDELPKATLDKVAKNELRDLANSYPAFD